MKYDSKTASDTLIGAENIFGRVETVETWLKTGEPSRRAAGGAAGASPEGVEPFASSRAEGLPTPLCDTWRQ